MRCVLLALLTATGALSAGGARAQDAAPTVKLPVEMKIRAGTLGELKAETTGKHVEWFVPTPGLDVRTCDSGKTLLFAGPEGVWTVYCFTAAGDVPSKVARCVVTIGAPAPGPGPAPPDPIPPPVPVDPLKAKLKAAFDSSAGTADQKREWAKDLAALYRAAAKLSADPSIVTAAALKTKITDAAKELLREAPIKDPLIEVRRVVAAELGALLPVNADLTDEQRAGAAALFTKLATHLESIARE